MFYKVRSVEAIEKYKLLVTFEDETTKIYDVKPLFEKWSVFKVLENNYELFSNVKVDLGGYGISWNDEIDLSCNELWENGKETAN